MLRFFCSACVAVAMAAPAILNAQTPFADSLKSVLAKDSTNTTILLALSKITRSTKPAEAAKYSLKALDISRRHSSYGGVDSALYELASVNYVQGKLEAAADYLFERIEYASAKNDSVSLVRSYNFAGGILNEVGKRVEALEMYLKAKNIADQLSDLKIKYSVTYNLALYYHDDREKAMAFRLQAYEISKQIEDGPTSHRRTAEITSVLANEYVLLKDNVAARRFLKEAFEHASKANARSLEAFCNSVFSELVRSEKKLDSAIVYQTRSIEIKESIGEKNRLHDSYGLLGEIYLQEGQPQKAINSLSKAIALAEESESMFFQYRWLPKLADAYAASGAHRLAFETMSRFHILSDTVMNAEKIKAIAEMETKYESEKKQAEIESLKKEQGLQERINANQQIIFSMIAVGLFLGGAAYYFRARAKSQENRRLTEKVDAQNRELSTISLLVNKKNEALQNIRAKLIYQPHETADDALRLAVKEIDREIAFDSEWDTFKFHFEKVHPNFFATLSKATPELTDRELRFCAYLKSNLSTKEIAQLTNITVRGVQQTKYRINQKFRETGGSLDSFLKGK